MTSAQANEGLAFPSDLLPHEKKDWRMIYFTLSLTQISYPVE
jgi:hypothetical protein